MIDGFLYLHLRDSIIIIAVGFGMAYIYIEISILEEKSHKALIYASLQRDKQLHSFSPKPWKSPYSHKLANHHSDARRGEHGASLDKRGLVERSWIAHGQRG